MSSSSAALPARLLRWSGVGWFSVAAAGQLAFIGFILAYYGVRTLAGRFAAWNDKSLIKGYVGGDDIGNTVFAAHVLLAAVMTLAGLMQLLPGLRRTHPRLHRWTGRLFLTLAAVMALSGAWLTIVRGTFLSSISAVAILLDAVLILTFGAMTLTRALQRRFDAHRVWAMRTFMAASGVWFLRVGFMGWVLLNQGPVGMNKTMSGPTDVLMGFGCYLIPLAMLETYLAATRSRHAAPKLFAALLVGAATLFTAVGVFGTIFLMWLPDLP